jgi:hypothetical protein
MQMGCKDLAKAMLIWLPFFTSIGNLGLFPKRNGVAKIRFQLQEG